MAESRFSRLLSIAGFILDHWPWITSPVFGALMTWVVSVTPALRPYAPISYVVAFVLTTLLVMAIILLGTWAAERIAKRNWWKEATQPIRSVNPLETTFSNIRVALMEFADPETRAIRGKTFVGCEIIGRGLTFVYSGCYFQDGAIWAGSDFISMPVNDETQNPMRGPTIKDGFSVEGCVFRSCKFYFQTAVFPEPNAREIARVGQGLNWLVPPRSATPPVGAPAVQR